MHFYYVRIWIRRVTPALFNDISSTAVTSYEECTHKFAEGILTFFWPSTSVYLSQYLTNLMHKICFTISFISRLYMFRAHVLIIRRSKLHYTSSGIITAIGGRLVHETATYSCDDTRGCVMQFWPADDEHMRSKHVEARNKTYCKTNLVHQVG